MIPRIVQALTQEWASKLKPRCKSCQAPLAEANTYSYKHSRCKACVRAANHTSRDKVSPEERRARRLGRRPGRGSTACRQCGVPLNDTNCYQGRSPCKACIRKAQIRYGKTLRARFTKGRFGALYRGLHWSLSLEDYTKVVAASCAYCGTSNLGSGHALDRKDNARGYEPDNVVPCCPTCNLTKGALWTHEQRLLIGRALQDFYGRC